MSHDELEWSTRNKGGCDLQTLARSLLSFSNSLDLYAANRTLLKDSQRPRISIVTPSYNQAQFLERTIHSVLNQGYPNLEYIICDGGSTDGSVNIIRKFEKYLAYWVSEPDQGQTHAINKGFRRATGDWVGFQNADDLYVPSAFDSLAELSKSNPFAELLYGDFFVIDEEGGPVDIQLGGIPFVWAQIANLQIRNQAAVWKRNLLFKHGFLDEGLQFCMDYELIMRYLSRGASAVKIDRILGAFRRHSGSKSANIRAVHDRERIAVTRRLVPGILSLFPRKLILFIEKLYKCAWFVGKGQLWYVTRHL